VVLVNGLIILKLRSPDVLDEFTPPSDGAP